MLKHVGFLMLVVKCFLVHQMHLMVLIKKESYEGLDCIPRSQQKVSLMGRNDTNLPPSFTTGEKFPD